MFEILFWLEKSKNDYSTPQGRLKLQVFLSLSQCTLLLPKNALLFPELPFYFPEFPFYFTEVPFCFLELPFCFPEMHYCFSEVSFYLSKIPYCFPELPFSFPEVPSLYLLCTSFQNAFFPADCTLSWSGLLREICLVLVLFSRGTLY